MAPTASPPRAAARQRRARGAAGASALLRPLRDPTFRRAPLLLLRYPAVLAALVLTGVLLGASAAAGALYLASASNAALERELDRLDADAAGFTLTTRAVGSADAYDAADTALRAEVDATLPELGAARTSLRSTPVLAHGAGEEQLRVRVAAGDAPGGSEVVDGRPRPGAVSLPAAAADALGLRPGDEVVLDVGGRRFAMPVAALLADAAAETSEDMPVLVTDTAGLHGMAEALGVGATATWTFPLVRDDLTLPEARAVAARYERLERAVRDRGGPLGEAVAELTAFRTRLEADSSLPPVIARVDDALRALVPPVRTLSLAGVGMALVVLGAAAGFRVRQRHDEHTLLVVRGVGPTGQALRAVAEAAPLLVLGCLVGWQLSSAAVGALGPAPRLDGPFAEGAAGHVGLAAVVGVVVVAAVTARAVAERGRRRLGRGRSRLARLPWEVAALALAAAAAYQLRLRGATPDAAASVDPLLLAFPLLFMGGLVGLATRALGRALPALRTRGLALPSAGYLAVRRLAGASATALLLVACCALGLGLLVYASALAEAADDAAARKARLAVGGDVAAALPRGTVRAAGPGPATVIARAAAHALPADRPVDMLTLDPDSFASAVRWDDDVTGAALPPLLEALGSGGDGAVPVVVAGGGGKEALAVDSIRGAGYAIAVRPVGRLAAFPGMGAERPLLVAPHEHLIAAVAAAGGTDPTSQLQPELWARGTSVEVVDALRAQGLPVTTVRSVEEIRAQPAVLAVGWAFDYLRALGALAGLLALLAIVAYLQERQRARGVSYALVSRMGLAPASHRRAVALELAGMLAAALALGTASALAAAAVVVPHADPLPDLAPATTLAWPWDVVAALLVAVALVCWAGARVVQRSTGRMRPGEVLRVAG